MLDIMYELPDQDEGSVYTIDESVVTGTRSLFQMPKTKSAERFRFASIPQRRGR